MSQDSQNQDSGFKVEVLTPAQAEEEFNFGTLFNDMNLEGVDNALIPQAPEVVDQDGQQVNIQNDSGMMAAAKPHTFA